ncbi:probable beta-D-xylosidase 2 [Gigantopelta aegis]|uniref:probable beta-D-xylosidase 2 n=1 Tax=Gigantopelta aegis TaxID=1735272 RepID=UPI001B88ABE9|nr:probable beta-D-xylosidase 2 [Gigantopelta aegis]
MSATTISDYPFRNISLPWNDRVDDLVSRLTMEEIKEQMSCGGRGPKGGPAPAITRLGIKPYSWNTECLRGDVDAGNATSFPQAIGLAATFSPSIVFSVAEATGIEVRAKFNDYMKHGLYGDHRGISPVVNIMRDPSWGRNQETYGEDPILSGMLAQSFVKGLQGNNSRFIRVNAGCKHFDRRFWRSPGCFLETLTDNSNLEKKTPTIDPSVTTTPLQSLGQLGKEFSYAPGCDSNACTKYNSAEIEKTVTGADVIFACPILEREGHDRADLEWPGKQLQVIQYAVKYGKGAPLVVFLFNAGPMNLTWAYNNDDVSAMFEVFFPAQATGEAMGRILTSQQDGDVPAGRLPNTWPKYIDDVPLMTDYTMEGKTYRYFKGEVYYPFGFGLSYTSFEYTEMITPIRVKDGEDVSGEIVVQNSGKYDADEVRTENRVCLSRGKCTT